MNSSLITWCNRLITIGFYLLFSLVPLLLTPWNYELFEYNKMMAVYAITALVVTAWLVKMINQGELRTARTPLDIPIWLFTASQLISTLFSIDPHVSWFGYYSRFNGGMWSIISYVLLYYALVSNAALFSKSAALRDTQNIDTKSAKTSKQSRRTNHHHDIHPPESRHRNRGMVAFYGVLERLGIDKHLWVQDAEPGISTGQPNWLAACLIALILSMALIIIDCLYPIGTRLRYSNQRRLLFLLLFCLQEADRDLGSLSRTYCSGDLF